MRESAVLPRKTKYCTEIKKILSDMGHATNYELLQELKKSFPELSATTVHRATARLCDRSEIAEAPSAKDGSKRYDANTTPHDHFLCVKCDLLRDADIRDKVIPILESSMDDCRISGSLTVSGVCKSCMKLDRKGIL